MSTVLQGRPLRPDELRPPQTNAADAPPELAGKLTAAQETPLFICTCHSVTSASQDEGCYRLFPSALKLLQHRQNAHGCDPSETEAALEPDQLISWSTPHSELVASHTPELLQPQPKLAANDATVNPQALERAAATPPVPPSNCEAPSHAPPSPTSVEPTEQLLDQHSEKNQPTGSPLAATGSNIDRAISPSQSLEAQNVLNGPPSEAPEDGAAPSSTEGGPQSLATPASFDGNVLENTPNHSQTDVSSHANMEIEEAIPGLGSYM